MGMLASAATGAAQSFLGNLGGAGGSEAVDAIRSGGAERRMLMRAQAEEDTANTLEEIETTNVTSRNQALRALNDVATKIPAANMAGRVDELIRAYS
ncbi:MAG: hypothetical protein EA385_05915 [Salinarimonadaceae bacterium]|nr:MAG: hypothetical protein EA385_05915 [Salinarimonadaceae bacterium]